jgi:hypothetical protein
MARQRNVGQGLPLSGFQNVSIPSVGLLSKESSTRGTSLRKASAAQGNTSAEKRRHISVPRVGFALTTPVLYQKTVHIGPSHTTTINIPLPVHFPQPIPSIQSTLKTVRTQLILTRTKADATA